MAGQRTENITSSDILEELVHIRKLLMALLVRDGLDSKGLARVLNMGDSTIRKMFPMNKIKKSKGE